MRYAGEGTGGLFEYSLNAEMSISRILSGNVKIFINEEVDTKPYCMDILSNDMGIWYSMDLSNSESKIYEEGIDDVSDSFEKLVFQCAVANYEKYYYCYSQYFAASANNFYTSKIGANSIDLFDFVHKVAVQYHLQEAWINDVHWYFAFSNEMSLLFRRHNAGYFYGKLCFNELKAAREMERVLSQIGARGQEIKQNDKYR